MLTKTAATTAAGTITKANSPISGLSAATAQAIGPTIARTASSITGTMTSACDSSAGHTRGMASRQA